MATEVVAAGVGKHEPANPAGDEADGERGQVAEEHRGHAFAPDAASLDHMEAQDHQEDE